MLLIDAYSYLFSRLYRLSSHWPNSSSIADLEDLVEADFRESVLAKLSWRLTRVTKRLRALDAHAEDYVWTPQLGEQLKLFALDLAFQDALKRIFPARICNWPTGRKTEGRRL